MIALKDTTENRACQWNYAIFTTGKKVMHTTQVMYSSGVIGRSKIILGNPRCAMLYLHWYYSAGIKFMHQMHGQSGHTVIYHLTPNIFKKIPRSYSLTR